MIKENVPPKFQTPPMSEKTQMNIMLSFEECEGLSERDIICPRCQKAIIGQVFSDATGHQRFKCKKCKAETVINLAYFRKVKGYKMQSRSYFGRLKVKSDEAMM